MTPQVPRGEKQQIYAQQAYWAGTLGPLVLLTALLLVSVVRMVTGETNRLDRYVLVVIPIVLVVNILGLRHPRRIIDSDSTLVFEGMRQRQVFRWSEITTLKVKEFAFTDRMYIRIGPSSLFAGAYWVDVHKYPQFGELRKKLLAKESELHPERTPYQKTLKPKARRNIR